MVGHPSSFWTNLACVLPVHGVDGGPRVHVHQVVVVVAGHNGPTPVVELHGEAGRRKVRTMGRDAPHTVPWQPWSRVRDVVAAPACYLDTCPTRGWAAGWDWWWSSPSGPPQVSWQTWHWPLQTILCETQWCVLCHYAEYCQPSQTTIGY